MIGDPGLLTKPDLQRLFEVICAANQGIGLADVRPGITAALKQFFHAGAVCFFLADEESGEIDQEDVLGSGLNMGFLDRWVKYYHRLDPFLFEPARRAVVCKVDDIISYEEWTQLEIYRDFYRPQRIHHKLSMFLRSNGTNIGLIGILRSKEYPDFSAADVEKARLLAPHLTTALENWRFFSGIRSGGRQFPHRGSASPLFGIMVLDCDLKPVSWNYEAYELCRSGFGKTCSGWGQESAEQALPIHPEILGDCARLRYLFQRKENRRASRYERIVEIGPDRTFRVVSSLIEDCFGGDSAPGFVVGVMDLSRIDQEGNRGIENEHGVTKRELEIVEYVCRGLTNEEIGQKLYISRFTVETHLRNIFSKTGVKHRAGLANIVRPLPRAGSSDGIPNQKA
jgi:DNA-binding CsgD family transcriptional regulator